MSTAGCMKFERKRKREVLLFDCDCFKLKIPPLSCFHLSASSFKLPTTLQSSLSVCRRSSASSLQSVTFKSRSRATIAIRPRPVIHPAISACSSHNPIDIDICTSLLNISSSSSPAPSNDRSSLARSQLAPAPLLKIQLLPVASPRPNVLLYIFFLLMNSVQLRAYTTPSAFLDLS
ncbi:unnamed protein product [Cyclocybe aegerita]|uniref:Uncharacterized protein n=1 Tax=Cyclocybe aegerita TaxID=1973307 RepID=A0A8S0X719_CYCAE|nr:unnamed protein product [Cyclocybe aegerita]